MSRKFSILFISLFVSLASAFAGTAHISVSPQRGKSKIEVGDLFYLTINVSGVSSQPKAPNLPGARLAYFEMMSGSAESYSVNGVTTGNYSGQWVGTYRAQQAGSYTAGPLSFGNSKSNQIKYSIGGSGSSSESASNGQSSQQNASATSQTDDDGKPKFIGKGDSNLFLKANVSSSSAYEQQALVYTLKLYTTYDGLNFLGATASPKFEGFVVEQSKDISSSWTFEMYNGKAYKTAVVAKYIIFPQMTGSLKVTGNTYTVSVSQREYYHDAFWGSLSFSTPLQLNVTPNDLVVNVKSLPEPKPADFSGGVGKFTIVSQLKNSEFKTNQAASIVYKVQGTGNVKYVQLPDLSALYPPEIEIYTPTTTQDISIGASNTSGSVTFDYSFMPLEEGEFRIPDVKLVYFNPETGKYETSVAKGYAINVGKGAAANNNRPKLKRFESKLQTVDMSDVKKTRTPWVYTFTYWLWFIIPVMILLTAFIVYRRYVGLHADMAAFNSKRANKLARRRLKKAAAAMRGNDADKFYDELLVALWGYLGDKLRMPTSELMRDNVRQVLDDRGVNGETTDMFIEIIDKAEFAKYSSAGGKENLRQAYDEAADMINRLEKEFKN